MLITGWNVSMDSVWTILWKWENSSLFERDSGESVTWFESRKSPATTFYMAAPTCGQTLKHKHSQPVFQGFSTLA